MTRKSKPLSAGETLEKCRLSELHFDMDNPRFGGRANSVKNEIDALNYIVENFGIEDVASSIASNGYFESEPLVGVEENGGIRVIEGNRRLAACLILAGDSRASEQVKRGRQYRAVMKSAGGSPPEEVPVLIVQSKHDKTRMLAYLGVRHICGLAEWDSFAKAAWIARVLEESKLSLEEITRMIGDRHGTAPRILEGFYFVAQLIDRDRFQPEQSFRKGRGSNPEYPFSWVYTALGYNNVRTYVGLNGTPPQKDPVPKPHLDDAQEVMRFLFGDKQKEIGPVVNDSRQISDLAVCLESPKKVSLLKQGKNVEEVRMLTRPAKQRLSDSLFQASGALNQAWQVIGEGIPAQEARQVLDDSEAVRSLAVNVHKFLCA